MIQELLVALHIYGDIEAPLGVIQAAHDGLAAVACTCIIVQQIQHEMEVTTSGLVAYIGEAIGIAQRQQVTARWQIGRNNIGAIRRGGAGILQFVLLGRDFAKED
jgi:hypothetical protein